MADNDNDSAGPVPARRTIFYADKVLPGWDEDGDPNYEVLHLYDKDGDLWIELEGESIVFEAGRCTVNLRLPPSLADAVAREMDNRRGCAVDYFGDGD